MSEKDHEDPCNSDAIGNPVHFMLTRKQVHDAKVAIDLLSGVDISSSNILGDKAYGAKKIREYITEQNTAYTIPPREKFDTPWYCDFHIYKERHLIECFLINSKRFAGLLFVMTSWLRLFLLLFTLLLSAFC